MTRPAYHITESEQYMKIQSIKLGVYKVICLAVKHHGHSLGVQIHIMQSLQFYEHLSEPMAECLTVLAKEFDHAQLGDEILREIAGKTFNSTDTKGPRAFARFLTKFAELAPRLILKQLSLLLGQLDSEVRVFSLVMAIYPHEFCVQSYPMRIALVEAIGYLITELAETGDGDGQDKKQTQKQINGLYELLLERKLDMSSYVRTKVLSVLAKLCDLKFKFPKQRLEITRAAVAALEDKGATVRKGAAALLVRLLVTHPYLTNGGFLELKVWEDDYHLIKDELAKVEDAMGKVVERHDEDEDEDEGNRVNGDDGDRQDEEEDGDNVDASKKRKMRYRSFKCQSHIEPYPLG